jgi:hypothetical protein
MDMISQKANPLVDSHFARYFPQYSDYLGDSLCHHHIGEDGQAVAIPESMHKGHGEIHNLEEYLGVTANAKAHSAECQKLLDTGQDVSIQNAVRKLEATQVKNTASEPVKTSALDAYERKQAEMQNPTEDNMQDIFNNFEQKKADMQNDYKQQDNSLNQSEGEAGGISSGNHGMDM